MRGFNVTEFRNIHTNWTSQVAYYGSLRTFVSSSQCSDCSMCVFDASGAKTQYKFRVLMGISCFTLCDGILTSQLIGANNRSILKRNGFFRESYISDWWTRLRNSRVESVRSWEGKCRSIGTPFDYLRACRDRRRQAHLFSVKRQMYKSMGCPGS